MRAEIVEEIEGRRVAFRLPIGGLERIAEVNPAIEEVRDSFWVQGPSGSRVWHLRELRAVLDAGAEYGDGMRSDEVVEAIGLDAARDLALRLMNSAFASSSPKKATGGEVSGSSSPPEI